MSCCLGHDGGVRGPPCGGSEVVPQAPVDHDVAEDRERRRRDCHDRAGLKLSGMRGRPDVCVDTSASRICRPLREGRRGQQVGDRLVQAHLAALGHLGKEDPREYLGDGPDLKERPAVVRRVTDGHHRRVPSASSRPMTMPTVAPVVPAWRAISRMAWSGGKCDWCRDSPQKQRHGQPTSHPCHSADFTLPTRTAPALGDAGCGAMSANELKPTPYGHKLDGKFCLYEGLHADLLHSEPVSQCESSSACYFLS